MWCGIRNDTWPRSWPIPARASWPRRNKHGLRNRPRRPPSDGSVLPRCASFLKNAVQHRLGQSAREGVLLARMIATQEIIWPHLGQRSMTESGLWSWSMAELAEGLQDAVPGKSSEADDHARSLQ